MKKLSLLSLLSICFTSCFQTNKGFAVLFDIKYTDEVVDKEALDQYFLNNKEEYPTYLELKKNVPNVLDKTKVISSNENFVSNNISIIRFSSDGNGFLNAQTFLYDKTVTDGNKFFCLGTGSGGYGVTQFIRQQGDAGSWIYFLYSHGSGIHMTEIGAYEIGTSQLYKFESEELPFMAGNYALNIDENDVISVYEANIKRTYGEEYFPTFDITSKNVVINNLIELTKTKI